MSSDHPLDHAAIGQLYQAHHSWLRGWLSRRTGCREHAADLAQETFVRLLDQLKPRVREAFLLAQLDGLTCAQIALRLGVSKATVERDLSKALHACYRLRYAEC
ncbi:sigma factor-like helix-turn-helix DNA-binding protein [Pseudomonas pergaminensis]